MDKTITVNFASGRLQAGYFSLWQWDHGTVLRMLGLDLKEAPEVHFAPAHDNTSALVVQSTLEGEAITVAIPDSLLALTQTGTDYKIRAWLYLEDGTAGRTMRVVEIKVRTRPKPEDYTYTPEEIKTWEKLEKNKADTIQIKDNTARLLSGENILSEAALPANPIPTVSYLYNIPNKKSAPYTHENDIYTGLENYRTFIVTSSSVVGNDTSSSIPKVNIPTDLKPPLFVVTGDSLDRGMGTYFFGMDNNGRAFRGNAVTGSYQQLGITYTSIALKQSSSLVGKVLAVGENGMVAPESIEIPVTSVNGKTGEIVLHTTDVLTPREVLTENDIDIELFPNVLYVFPNLQSLTYTLLVPEDDSYAYEYHFMFLSGETAAVVTHPPGLSIGDFAVESNKIYEVRIAEGLLLYQSWEVGTTT